MWARTPGDSVSSDCPLEIRFSVKSKQAAVTRVVSIESFFSPSLFYLSDVR